MLPILAVLILAACGDDGGGGDGDGDTTFACGESGTTCQIADEYCLLDRGFASCVARPSGCDACECAQLDAEGETDTCTGSGIFGCDLAGNENGVAIVVSCDPL